MVLWTIISTVVSIAAMLVALLAVRFTYQQLQLMKQGSADEKRRIEFARFSPKTEIIGDADQQAVRLEADESFVVESIEYLNASGARIAGEDVNKSGTMIEIRLNQSYLMTVRNAGPWVNQGMGTAEAAFQFNIERGGQRKQHVQRVMLTHGARGSYYYTKAVG